MKKQKIALSIFIIAILTSNFIYSQKFYSEFAAGYKFPISSKYDAIIEDNSNQETTYIVSKNSLGDGLNSNIRIGYKFLDQLAFELGLSYVFNRIGGLNENQKEFVVYGFDIERYPYESESYANMFYFLPAVKLMFDSYKLNPYVRFGGVIGIGKFIEEDEFNDFYNRINIQTLEYSGGVALGVHAGLGISYPYSDKITFFSEANFISLSYAPKKMIITKYTIDGEDRLSSMSTYDKEIEFVNNYNRNDFSPDEPQKVIKRNYPFSSVGINVGIAYKF